MSYPCRSFGHVFEGGGFGVGLAVNRVAPPPGPDEALPDGVESHPSRLGELMPVEARSDAELAAEMRRAAEAESKLWAYRVEMVAELAARRPAARDRAPGRPGAAAPGWTTSSWVLDGTSEFLPDEIAMIFTISRAQATQLAEVALTLVHRLPDTLAALPDGELSWPRARALAQEINRCGPELDQHLTETVEAVVLPQAAELSITRLRALVRAELVRRDQEVAEQRREQAELTADVRLRSGGTEEGMSEVVTVLPHPVAAAVVATVDAVARAVKAQGDPRPIGQIRAEVMARLTLRPGDDGLPPVSPEIRVLAPLRSLLADPAAPSAPGAPTGIAVVEGEPVTAAHLRALLTAADAVCPGGLQPPTGGSLFFDLLGGGGQVLASLTRRELEQAARRGCPDHPSGDCRCPVAGKPPPTEAYTPTAAQRRFVTARDRGCRHPGCPNPAGWADLDHAVPHAEGGETDCDNLCCLCRRHHRLKTHAPGWAFRLDADGDLHVTTPSGVTRIDRPPGPELLEPFELGEELPPTVDPAPF
jgi:hypothetical protein